MCKLSTKYSIKDNIYIVESIPGKNFFENKQLKFQIRKAEIKEIHIIVSDSSSSLEQNDNPYRQTIQYRVICKDNKTAIKDRTITEEKIFKTLKEARQVKKEKEALLQNQQGERKPLKGGKELSFQMLKVLPNVSIL